MAAAPTRSIFTFTLFLGFLAAALAAGENSASEALALKPEPLAPKLEPKNMRRKMLDDDYCDDNILNAAGCALDAAANAAADIANDLLDSANDAANEVAEDVNNVANDVVNTANNIADDVVDQVNDAATSFTNGFNNAYNSATQASGAFIAGQHLWVTMIVATLLAAAATM